MVIRIARKELLEMTRDGRFRTAGGVVLLLLLTALGLGWQRHADVSAAHETSGNPGRCVRY
jgi:ABC-2 type transport system permease protein